MKAVKVIDIIISLLVLWSHISISFWDYSSVPTWRIEGNNFSESIRSISDWLIIGVLVFHIIDLMIGKIIWKSFQNNKSLNYALVILLFGLMSPYLELWFSYFYYGKMWTDLIRTFFYLLPLSLWTFEIYKRKMY